MFKDIDLWLPELVFKFSRSGGAGGQHVNKVSSKVLLQWDVQQSELLSEQDKLIVRSTLANRITKEGILQLDCDSDRSQAKNKEIAIRRFLTILDAALTPIKPRKKTKIPYFKIIDRLDRKRRKSELKQSRSKLIKDGS